MSTQESQTEIVLNKHVAVDFEEADCPLVCISYGDVQVTFIVSEEEVLDVTIDLGHGKIVRDLENVELPLESFPDVMHALGEAEGYRDSPSPFNTPAEVLDEEHLLAWADDGGCV